MNDGRQMDHSVTLVYLTYFLFPVSLNFAAHSSDAQVAQSALRKKQSLPLYALHLRPSASLLTLAPRAKVTMPPERLTAF